MQSIFRACLTKYCPCVLFFVLIYQVQGSRADTSPIPTKLVTPTEWLQQQPYPKFHAGHTLLPLTRFGWPIPFDAIVELADHWGYALEFFGGDLTDEQVNLALTDPKSIEAKSVALCLKYPQRYKLAVKCPRDLPVEQPSNTWTRNAEGKLLDREGHILDESVAQAAWKKVYSPESPDIVWQQAGVLRAAPLRRLRALCPISMILNGGEYGLDVLGAAKPIWMLDPVILKAKGDRPWFDYVSERKAHEESLMADAVRAVVPDRLCYVYYTTSGVPNSHSRWTDWGFGFEWMRAVSDLPSDEAYYMHGNTGWSGDYDVLTRILYSVGFEIAQNEPLSYNWICDGWPRKGTIDDNVGDVPRWTGFLKCYYTAGMLGANVGYYDYPTDGFSTTFAPDHPPPWLRQMAAAGQVHALFSRLENFLRKGDLLPGPNTHRWSHTQPAYEFSTGVGDSRVLVRKLRDHASWLITAWASDGQDRPVKVNIPQLGEVTVQARACGSVYRAHQQHGKTVLELIDIDGMAPTARQKE